MRLDYFATPSGLRQRIDTALGAPVVSAENAAGGYSPGPASSCDLGDGRRVFIKACSEELSAFATQMHRREAEVLARFPDHILAPAFIDGVNHNDWFALVVEHVDGQTPREPLTPESVDQALQLIEDLAATGPECPDGVDVRVGEGIYDQADRWPWQQIVDDGLADELDPWARANLGALVGHERDWIDAAHGESLVHGDLRTDNMVLTAAGGVAVDWPGATRGADWLDLLGLLPAMNLAGGPHPWDVFDAHPVGALAEPAAVTTNLAMLAGYFVYQSLLPPPPNLARLRTFQADQGAISLSWLRHRLGDPPST